MGRLKPKKSRRNLLHVPLGADTTALLSERGIEPRLHSTPQHLVPMSEIVGELVEPMRRQLEQPDSQPALALLADMAGAVWNMSRMALRPEFSGDTEEMLIQAFSARAGALPVAQAMFDHACALHPQDTRMIVRTSVEVDGNGVHFRAFSLRNRR